MKLTLFSSGIILTFFLMSCVNPSPENSSNIVENDTTSDESLEVIGIEIPDIDTQVLIQELQGVWQEPEYPFNRVEFRNSMVKMVEEGVAEPSKFRPFTISHHCPYDVNNMEKIQVTDTIIFFNAVDRCEKITLMQDTLILSGFNAHSQQTYRIDYVRVQ